MHGHVSGKKSCHCVNAAFAQNPEKRRGRNGTLVKQPFQAVVPRLTTCADAGASTTSWLQMLA